MGLRPDREAPPQNLRGITSWPWGTTTKPSWNYVLSLHVAPPWTLTMRFMELRPLDKAPPWTPPRRIHGITSIRWGTTMSSHYKSHRITSYPYLVHVLPTNHRVSMHTNLMSVYIDNQPYKHISYQAHTNSSVTAHNIHNTCIFTPFMFKIEQISQSSNQQQLCKENSNNPR